MIWYTLMAVLPLAGGYDGMWISVQLAMTALAGLVIYTLAKRISGRERRYVQHADRVSCSLPPLDRDSFPSGHTLHAVSFTLVLCGHLPAMAWVLQPFATLVALSQMILGLHYPSDVLAGTVIGAVLGRTSLDVLALPGIR